MMTIAFILGHPLPRIPDGQGIEHKAHKDQEIVINAIVGQASDVEKDKEYGDEWETTLSRFCAYRCAPAVPSNRDRQVPPYRAAFRDSDYAPVTRTTLPPYPPRSSSS